MFGKFIDILKHHFQHATSTIEEKAYRELSLVRALDEDTRIFSFFFSFFTSGPDNCVWKFCPSTVTLGVFVFLLAFCESLCMINVQVRM